MDASAWLVPPEAARLQEAGASTGQVTEVIESAFSHLAAVRNLAAAHQLMQCMAQAGWRLALTPQSFQKYAGGNAKETTYKAKL